MPSSPLQRSTVLDKNEVKEMLGFIGGTVWLVLVCLLLAVLGPLLMHTLTKYYMAMRGLH
jgi:hypothetical protein